MKLQIPGVVTHSQPPPVCHDPYLPQLMHFQKGDRGHLWSDPAALRFKQRLVRAKGEGPVTLGKEEEL